MRPREKERLRTRYGPWAVVTGASSGIGKELAERTAEAGINVLLAARRRDVLEELAGRLRTQHAIETRVVEADLSQMAGVEQVLAASRDVDVGLFIAAAGYGTSGTFIESSLDEELNMLQVNCAAVLAMTHEFSNRFVRRRRGGIVLMSSIVAFQGVPYAGHYSATKAYIQSLAEALAVELRPHGVDVLAPVPGPVRSGFGERANMRMSAALTPEQLGVPILRALGRSNSVLPGFLSKLLVGSLRTVPRPIKTRIMQDIMGGMTKHQRKAT